MIISIYIAGKRCTAVNYCKMLLRMGAYYKSNSQEGVRKNAPRRTEAGGRRLSFRKKPMAFTSKTSSPVWCMSPTDSGNAIPWGYSQKHRHGFLHHLSFHIVIKWSFFRTRINDRKTNGGHWGEITSLVAWKFHPIQPNWLFRHLPALLSSHVTCHDAHLSRCFMKTPKRPCRVQVCHCLCGAFTKYRRIQGLWSQIEVQPVSTSEFSKTVEVERNVGFWGFGSVGKNMNVYLACEACQFCRD